MNQTNQTNSDNVFKELDLIDLKKIFRYLLIQPKTVIFITLIGFLLSSFSYLNTPKQYKISSMLQVYSNSSSPFETGGSSDVMFGLANTTDVNLYVNLYKTRTNIVNLINEFNLNVFTENYEIDFNEIKIKNVPLGEPIVLRVSLYEQGYDITNVINQNICMYI